MGLISTFGMLNHTSDIQIHAHPDLEKLMKPQLKYFCEQLPFQVQFLPFNPSVNEMSNKDRTIQVSCPSRSNTEYRAVVFFLRKKTGDRHIIRDMIDFYKVPVWKIGKIKLGEDFTTEEGEIISNDLLTLPPTPPSVLPTARTRRTAKKSSPLLEGVDMLYHRATFMEDELYRARATQHSTARQAAEIAKKANVKRLIIGHYSARYNPQNRPAE